MTIVYWINLQVSVLLGCYWSEMWLKNRTDIAEIYNIKEKDLFGNHSQIDDFYTAVFIHKKVIISKGTDGHENRPPKYEAHKRMYYCTSEHPKIRMGRPPKKVFFRPFGPHFGLKIRWALAPLTPPLDPPLKIASKIHKLTKHVLK